MMRLPSSAVARYWNRVAEPHYEVEWWSTRVGSVPGWEVLTNGRTYRSGMHGPAVYATIERANRAAQKLGTKCRVVRAAGSGASRKLLETCDEA